MEINDCFISATRYFRRMWPGKVQREEQSKRIKNLLCSPEYNSLTQFQIPSQVVTLACHVTARNTSLVCGAS